MIFPSNITFSPPPLPRRAEQKIIRFPFDSKEDLSKIESIYFSISSGMTRPTQQANV